MRVFLHEGFLVSLCVCQSAPVRALVVPACCERGLVLRILSLDPGTVALQSDSQHEDGEALSTVHSTAPATGNLGWERPRAR